MRKLLVFVVVVGFHYVSFGQDTTIIREGHFKKNKFGQSSKSYKPDDWEKPLFDSSVRSAFPSDLVKDPSRYRGKLIHLVGTVDSVNIDNSQTATLYLENKYWDYIEDYSIQDEIMFVSEKGGGKFVIMVPNVPADAVEQIRNFPGERKLLLVYGNFRDTSNSKPLLTARGIKFIDYRWYTTKVMSYEIARDKNGAVVVDKHGKAQLANFDFFKVAGPGQNK